MTQRESVGEGEYVCVLKSKSWNPHFGADYWEGTQGGEWGDLDSLAQKRVTVSFSHWRGTVRSWRSRTTECFSRTLATSSLQTEGSSCATCGPRGLSMMVGGWGRNPLPLRGPRRWVVSAWMEQLDAGVCLLPACLDLEEDGGQSSGKIVPPQGMFEPNTWETKSLDRNSLTLAAREQKHLTSFIYNNRKTQLLKELI